MAKNDSGNNRGEALIGTVVTYEFSAPTNWLACDGSAVSQATYAELYSVIGQRYYTFTTTDDVAAASGKFGYVVDWHPSSNYVAVGGDNTDKELAVYSFDGTTLTEAETVDMNGKVEGLSWHPGGYFLAATIGNLVKVYSWNGTNTLSEVESVDLSYSVRRISWHPNGNFLATSHISGGTKELQVFSWNGSDTLTEVESLDFANHVVSVDWSNNGNYLSVGSYVTTGFQVYSWNGSDTLTYIDGYAYSGNFIFNSVWSAADDFIFMGGNLDNNEVKVFSFNGTTLSVVTTIACTGTPEAIVALDYTGKYLLVALRGNAAYTHMLYLYEWDGVSTLTELHSVAKVGYGASQVDVSYTGDYMAYGGNTNSSIVLWAGIMGDDPSTKFALPTVADSIIRSS